MTETTTSAQDRGNTTQLQVQVTAAIKADSAGDIATYAEQRLRKAFEQSRLPVLHARIRITRYPDPARACPVVAQANVSLDGRFVRAQLSAPTAREAVDLLHDRLRQRLQHVTQRAEGNWEDRRSRYTARKEHEWRHGDEPTHQPPYYPRPPEEREIVRHKSVRAARCGVDEAAADMNDMDYDFHLFTEAGSGQDSVVYRSGPTGYRLAQLAPVPEAVLAPHRLPLTISDSAAPRMSLRAAAQRMAVWNQPFLFFQDAESERGAVLYHRYDGHYGLITPAGRRSDGWTS